MQCCELEGALPPTSAAADRHATEPRPFRIDPLPRVVSASDVAAGAATASGRTAPGRDSPAAAAVPAAGGSRATDARQRLLVGVAGDESEPLGLTLGGGDVLLALGGPGTGKTGFLEALPAMNPGLDFASADRAARADLWEQILAAHNPAGGEDGRPVVLVDDADGLTAQEEQLLARLLEAGHAVVATAGYSANLYARCPLALTARSSGVGLLIAPRAPVDGEVFGLRVDVPGRVPPGRAVAVLDGQCVDVQLGHVASTVAGPPVPFSREAPPASAA